HHRRPAHPRRGGWSGGSVDRQRDRGARSVAEAAMSAHPRIAANDPALAHALMHRAVIEEGSAVAKRLKALLPAAVTVPKLSVAIRKSFGPQLVLQQVGRLHGSRANAIW